MYLRPDHKFPNKVTFGRFRAQTFSFSMVTTSSRDFASDNFPEVQNIPVIFMISGHLPGDAAIYPSRGTGGEVGQVAKWARWDGWLGGLGG